MIYIQKVSLFNYYSKIMSHDVDRNNMFIDNELNDTDIENVNLTANYVSSSENNSNKSRRNYRELNKIIRQEQEERIREHELVGLISSSSLD